MGNTKLTPRDQELISHCLKAGVLDKLDSHKLCAKEGLSIVMCGDPDEHPEAYEYKVGQIVQAGCLKRIHAPAPLGGALRLAPNSPTNEATPGYDLNLLYDLEIVREKKGITTIALYVHTPCYIAGLAQMSFADIIRHAFAAKLRIKNTMPGIKVAVFCHIDRGEGDKKTYFVSRTRWEEFNRPGPPTWAPELKAAFPNRVTIQSAARI